MEITAEERQDIVIVHINGRMDATTVADFEEFCRSKLEENKSKLVVSMQGLEYISSAGLRGILLMEKMSRAKGGKIVFCALQEMVAEVFKISGFTSILKISPNIDEAIASLC